MPIVSLVGNTYNAYNAHLGQTHTNLFPISRKSDQEHLHAVFYPE
jgi:hypothetical protein